MRYKVVPPPLLLLLGGPFNMERRSFHGLVTDFGGSVYTVRKLIEYRNDADRVEMRVAHIATHQSIDAEKFRADRAAYARLLTDEDWTDWARIPGAYIGRSR